VIGEEEVRRKTDDELGEIWVNQVTYVPEMVAWVKAEITRRNLNIDGIHVVTEKELGESARISSASGLIRFVAIFQSLSVVLLVFIALVGFSNIIWIKVILLSIAVLLIVISAGVLTRKKWAFAVGALVYALIASFIIVMTIVGLVRVLMSAPGILGPAAISPIGLVLTVIAIVCMSGIALAFNTLRKQLTQ
jgi:hypothetical protein